MIADMPAPEAIDRIADWMVEDEDMRHWRLWLNAQDEAHRDPLLAEVMNKAMQDWHGLIADLLQEAGEGEGAPRAIDAGVAAWRLAALMDGLAGAMLVKGSVITPDTARKLIGVQIRFELGGTA